MDYPNPYLRALRMAMAAAVARLLPATRQGRARSMIKIDPHDRMDLNGPWDGLEACDMACGGPLLYASISAHFPRRSCAIDVQNYAQRPPAAIKCAQCPPPADNCAQ
ncbi:hypothetical protein D3C71_1149040 [compost metagenome]